MNVVGATISVNPFVMQAPVRGMNTSLQTLQVFWQPLVNEMTGGSPIDSYNLQWDRATNGTQWLDLCGDGILHPYSTALNESFS